MQLYYAHWLPEYRIIIAVKRRLTSWQGWQPRQALRLKRLTMPKDHGRRVFDHSHEDQDVFEFVYSRHISDLIHITNPF